MAAEKQQAALAAAISINLSKSDFEAKAEHVGQCHKHMNVYAMFIGEQSQINNECESFHLQTGREGLSTLGEV